jgi:phospho-N-acetylmuramoyl-pentapeptide-transferase
MEHLSDVVLILTYSAFAFVVAFARAPPFIRLLVRFRIGKNIREDASGGGKATLFSALHAHKQGTPTMGGILIVLTVIVMVLFSRVLSFYGIIDHSLLNRRETYIPLFTLITTALLGGFDDWLNLRGLWKKGIPVKPKFLLLLVLSLVGAWWFHFKLGYFSVSLPYFGDLYLGSWYILLFVLTFIASGHAVNITDGVDGLAGGLLFMSYTIFAAIAFHQGLFLLATFCGVTSGAILAFLWFNIHPATFFMGDIGSLSLGATLGVIALLTDQLVPYLFVSFIYIMETLSVIVQWISKRFRNGKKVFLIAPIHHHFEKIGWPEPTVVMKFWIIGGVFGILGLVLAMTSDMIL